MKAPHSGGYCFPAVSAGNSSVCVCVWDGSLFSDGALSQIMTNFTFTSPDCPRPLTPSKKNHLIS